MMHHILSAQQLDVEVLQEVFERADRFREQVGSDEGLRDLARRYVGRTLVNLFYEPSTRTRISFGKAAAHLGMQVEGTENAREFSSAAKGETLEHTIRVIGDAYDTSIVVLRHPETGAANRAAAVSERATIINAGDGKGEHPTQAALDMYTIKEKKGRTHDLHIVMGGDLERGRTARSLAKLVGQYDGNRISFVSTPELQIGDDIKDFLDDSGTPHQEVYDMYEALRDADVVYWTRLQSEREEALGKLSDLLPEDLEFIVSVLAPDAVDQDRLREAIETQRDKKRVGATIDAAQNQFIIDQAALAVMRRDVIIMHPLPITGEIHPSVDNDPRAVYFQQAGLGKSVRMALIEMIMQEQQRN